jgi:hypothetical protein
VSVIVAAAGQHTTYRAIGLGQRPFLEGPFSTHLRDLEAYKKRGVPSSQSSDGSQSSYKQDSQGEHTEFFQNYASGRDFFSLVVAFRCEIRRTFLF